MKSILPKLPEPLDNLIPRSVSELIEAAVCIGILWLLVSGGDGLFSAIQGWAFPTSH